MRKWQIITQLGAEWDDLVRQTKNYDFYHLSTYISSLLSDGETEPLLLALFTEHGLTVHPLIKRSLRDIHPGYANFFDVISAYGYGGPAWVCRNLEDEERLLSIYWQEESVVLQDLKVVSEFVRLNPLVRMPDPIMQQFGFQVRWKTIAIDLANDRESLWAGLSENHKRNIKNANKSGILVRFYDHPSTQELSYFYEIYIKTMDRLQAKPEYYFSLGKISRLFQSHSGSAWIALALKDDSPQAAFLFFAGLDYMHYHLGGSSDSGRNLGASHLLMYESILFAKSVGKKMLHLGGGYGGDQDGLFRFKQGFGGKERQFVTRQHIIMPDIFQKVCDDLNVDSNSRYFPPYRSQISQFPGQKQRISLFNHDRNRSAIRVLIVGAGGHGMVVCDILQLMSKKYQGLSVIGFLDDRETAPRDIYGFPVLGFIHTPIDIEYEQIILAVGDNRTRADLFQYFREKKEIFATAIHPSAIISPYVEFGEGTVFCSGAVVTPCARIGSNVIVNTGATIDHHNVLEDHVHIAPGVHLGGDVFIGEGTLVGLGAHILPGIRIGRWCVIGAGSVVTHDIGDCTLAFGNPARVIKQLPG